MRRRSCSTSGSCGRCRGSRIACRRRARLRDVGDQRARVAAAAAAPEACRPARSASRSGSSRRSPASETAARRLPRARTGLGRRAEPMVDDLLVPRAGRASRRRAPRSRTSPSQSSRSVAVALLGRARDPGRRARWHHPLEPVDQLGTPLDGSLRCGPCQHAGELHCLRHRSDDTGHVLQRGRERRERGHRRRLREHEPVRRRPQSRADDLPARPRRPTARAPDRSRAGRGEWRRGRGSGCAGPRPRAAAARRGRGTRPDRRAGQPPSP